MKGLIVIPAFNEEQSLAPVLAAIRRAGCSESVLVIDDGSTDATARAATAGGAEVLRHPRNLGYAHALRAGMRFAVAHDFDYLVFVDGDGQHDPREIESLRACALADRGLDIVIGSRFVGARDYRAPLERRLGMMLFSWLTALAGGRRIYDTTSGFKLIRRRALTPILRHAFSDFHADLIIFSLVAGLRVREVPVTVGERRAGASMYQLPGSAIYVVKTLAAIVRLWPAARMERHRYEVKL
jgi:glycosyltransferase involved in cell wall biosynthesis